MPGPEKPDLIFHYSVWFALVNLIYDGTLTTEELKTKGDIAIGSYNGLNGELVMVDGNLYQITEDGAVHEPGNKDLICYANATFFDKEQGFDMEGPVNYDILRSKINEALSQTQDFLNAIFENTFQYDTR
jgi:acetolactate decarboxylase